MNKEVEQVLSQYIAAWNAMDFAVLHELWDHNEDEIHYVAEEVEEPFYSLTSVNDYWRATAKFVEQIEMSISDVRQRMLSADVYVVTYAMHMDATLSGNGDARSNRIGVDVRVSAILKQSAYGWRFIHYVEAPLGALPFVRKCYSDNSRR